MPTACFAFFGTVDDHTILLTSADATEVRHGAESVFDDFGGNRTLNDIAATRILAALDNPDSLSEDAMAWLTKAVGGSGSARYADVLTQVLERANGKAKSWAKLGLRRAKVPAEQLKRGEIDLDKLRNAALTLAPIVNQEFRSRLSAKQPKLQRQTAERMYYMASIVDDKSLDAASEFIQAHINNTGEAEKTAGWLCRLLGEVGREQDLASLSLAAKGARASFKKHAKEALRTLNRRFKN